jgi:hypothetical protein
MPLIIQRSDGPDPMFAYQHADDSGDIQWIPNRDKATRFTETEADIVVHEFSKYSDIEVDIVGAKALGEPPAEATAA